MPAHMYILECADGSYYTGSTKDIEKRLWQHQNGEGANYTKKRLPVKLVYAEPYDRVEDAFRREKQVQRWSRRKKKALIEANYDKLIEFSRNYTEFGKGGSLVDPAAASTSGS
ncbi:MAG: GIY-YIG nuclease family protein [Ardenticatenaceae bacterium]|nr:GIY-YIG nuclease family protein [Ardenticatenaceae bacterium]